MYAVYWEFFCFSNVRLLEQTTWRRQPCWVDYESPGSPHAPPAEPPPRTAGILTWSATALWRETTSTPDRTEVFGRSGQSSSAVRWRWRCLGSTCCSGRNKPPGSWGRRGADCWGDWWATASSTARTVPSVVCRSSSTFTSGTTRSTVAIARRIPRRSFSSLYLYNRNVHIYTYI